MRVVLLAAAPADQLFVLTVGEEDELDRQLLDDLGLGGVRPFFPSYPNTANERSSRKKKSSLQSETNPLSYI